MSLYYPRALSKARVPYSLGDLQVGSVINGKKTVLDPAESHAPWLEGQKSGLIRPVPGGGELNGATPGDHASPTRSRRPKRSVHGVGCPVGRTCSLKGRFSTSGKWLGKRCFHPLSGNLQPWQVGSKRGYYLPTYQVQCPYKEWVSCSWG